MMDGSKGIVRSRIGFFGLLSARLRMPNLFLSIPSLLYAPAFIMQP
jgi:hypothetical protein